MAGVCIAQTHTLVGEFGSSGSGLGEFNSPSFIAIDPVTHNIVVSDTGNSRVQIFDSAGRYVSEFGSVGSDDGQFGPATYTGDPLFSTEQLPSPAGVAIDPATGSIVMVDGTNARLQIFDASGNYFEPISPSGPRERGYGIQYFPSCVRISIDFGWVTTRSSPVASQREITRPGTLWCRALNH